MMLTGMLWRGCVKPRREMEDEMAKQLLTQVMRTIKAATLTTGLASIFME